jgi:hypothetical protein
MFQSWILDVLPLERRTLPASAPDPLLLLLLLLLPPALVRLVLAPRRDGLWISGGGSVSVGHRPPAHDRISGQLARQATVAPRRQPTAD